MTRDLMRRLVFGLCILGMAGGCSAEFPLSLIPDASLQPDSAVDPDGALPDSQVLADAEADADVPPGCGDGLISGSEACDDGNTQSGDGCSSACEIEEGWECTGEPSLCVSECGDGIAVGDEECDDGNSINGDGCNNLCEVDCSNESTIDCNFPGQTLNPDAAFVDPAPPEGFVQCAGFRNTADNDVGPHWEAHCLGEARTLRIRYWDTSNINEWVLLGDATLSPQSEVGYVTQVFDATNHAGPDGFRETGGVVALKDDKDALPTEPLSSFTCEVGPVARHYQATDLYFFTGHANPASVRLIVVSGWSRSEHATAIQADSAELASYERSTETCVNANVNGRFNLAMAIYYEL